VWMTQAQLLRELARIVGRAVKGAPAHFEGGNAMLSAVSALDKCRRLLVLLDVNLFKRHSPLAQKPFGAPAISAPSCRVHPDVIIHAALLTSCDLDAEPAAWFVRNDREAAH